MKLWALIKKELLQYFSSLSGLLISSIFVAVASWLFWSNFFVQNQVTVTNLVMVAAWLLVVLVPALTMRLFADEFRKGSFEVISTLPFKMSEIIIAKFIAQMIYCVVVLSSLLGVVGAVAYQGKLDYQSTGLGFLGLLLVAALFTSITLFLTLRMDSGVAVFMVGVLGCFIISLSGSPLVTSVIPTMARTFASFFSPLTYLDDFSVGLVSLTAVVYFVGGISIFLYGSYLQLVLRDRDTSAKKKFSFPVIMVILLVSFVLMVPLSTKLRVQLDFSADHVHTLTPASAAIVKKIPDVLTIKTYFSSEVPSQLAVVREQTKQFLDQLSVASGGKIVIHEEDVTNQENVAASGVPALQFNDLAQGKYQISQGYMGLTLEYRDKKEMFPVIQQTDDLEYQLINRIQTLTAEKLPKMALINADPMITAETSQGLSSLVQKRYELVNYDINQDKELPLDLSLIVITGAQGLNDWGKLHLDEALRKGIPTILLVKSVEVGNNLVGKPVENSSQGILDKLGIKINQDVVGDVSNENIPLPTNQGVVIAPYPYFVKVLDAGLNDSYLAELPQITMPFPSSIIINSDKVKPIIETTSKAFKAPSGNNLAVSQELIDKSGSEKFSLGVIYDGVYDGLRKEDFAAEAQKKYQVTNESKQVKVMVITSADLFADPVMQRFNTNAALAVRVITEMVANDPLRGVPFTRNLSRPITRNLGKGGSLVAQYGTIGGGVLLIIGLYLLTKFYRRRVRYV